MTIVKKIKKEDVKAQAVLNLTTENQGYEVAVGDGYYILYPLPAKDYTTLMGLFRDLWYRLISDKENKYTEAVNAARALSENMGEIDDMEVQSSVTDLMTKLTDSKNVHPLEFLTHEEFSNQIQSIIGLLTNGCDEEDVSHLTIEQLARLLEVCFIENFLPFIRLANVANRVFREDST